MMVVNLIYCRRIADSSEESVTMSFKDTANILYVLNLCVVIIVGIYILFIIGARYMSKVRSYYKDLRISKRYNPTTDGFYIRNRGVNRTSSFNPVRPGVALYPQNTILPPPVSNFG